jgi:hypothetical protein
MCASDEQTERTTIGMTLEVMLGALEQLHARRSLAQRDRDRHRIVGVERAFETLADRVR